MFWDGRFAKDLEAVCKVGKGNEELGARMMYDAIERYAKNNFVTGWLVAMAGSAVGIIGSSYVNKLKEKKNKELEGTKK